MLLLLFQVGDECYALDSGQIREVLPLVQIRPVPMAPAGVAGVFDFRGALVPVIDLTVLLRGTPAAPSLSTRLIIVDYPDSSGALRALGLIVEKATRTVQWQAEDFVDSVVFNERGAFLGGIGRDANGLVQQIDVGRLLSPAVREVLFRNRIEQPWPLPVSKAC